MTENDKNVPLQVKGPENVGPKRKWAVFLLKWFGIILFVQK